MASKMSYTHDVSQGSAHVSNPEMHGNDEPVVFNFDTADAVISRARSLGALLDEHATVRRGYADTALEQFKGHYADVFDENATVARNDARNISDVLGDLVKEVKLAKKMAAEERDRRKAAVEWYKERARRNDWEKGVDTVKEWVTGTDAPEGPKTRRLTKMDSPKMTARVEPTPGKSGSVSSANPDALRTFASNASTYETEVSDWVAKLHSSLGFYSEECAWAPLNTTSLRKAGVKFVENEVNDINWANVVASGFEAAGGSGTMSSLPDASIGAMLTAAGVREGREPISVKAPQFVGDPQTSGYADDPVNTTTGNFVEPETDLAFAGGSVELEFSRTYNSVNSALGSLGPGWSSIADSRLRIEAEGAAWTTATGRQIDFARNGTDWDRAVGENLWLYEDRTSHARWIIRDNKSGWFTFDDAGRPLVEGKGPQGTVAYEWVDDRLARITHRRHRSIELKWSAGDPGASKITGLSASDGRCVAFNYNSAGQLTAASVDGVSRSYEWNNEGLIVRVIDPDGVIEVDNSYNDQGQVIAQRSPSGRTSHYSYLPGGVTVVADEDGTRSNSWIHDAKGRLVGAVDSEGHRQSTAWDRWNNLVMFTDRAGSVTVREFDKRGRQVGEVRPNGVRIHSVYDDADRLSSVTVDAQGVTGVTTFDYRGEDINPHRVVDPSGGVTVFGWSEGLLTDVVDPTGVRLQLAYDAHGDLISTTNAFGNTARLERDGAGRVVAAITPLGNRTEYRYDERGCLESRRDPDGAISRFEHTEAGRMSAMIDPTGARIGVEYGDDGLESATIDALGREIATARDDLGNISSATLPDGSVWQFGFDAMSRVTEWTDVTGGHMTLRYDVNGNRVGITDPTGIERTTSYDEAGLPVRVADSLVSKSAVRDPLGRITELVGVNGLATHYRYDACGRVIELTDAAGGVTTIERDAAGRPTMISEPAGQTRGYEYDRAGRWSATIASGGERFEMVYDADSRIVAEHWPDDAEASTVFDVNGRVVERTEPGRGLTRFGYDKAGRIASIRDAWHGHRRFVHDQAGQLVKAINPLGGETLYGHDELAHVTSITDPLGGVSHREYDQLGRLLSSTDPDGRVTHYSYDAAGRQLARVEHDGAEYQFTYDATGYASGTAVGGKLLSSISRDVAARVGVIKRGPHTDTLTFGPMGQLVSHDRDGRTTTWSYDLAGRRTGLMRPNGVKTSYGYDDDGKLAWIDQPGLGRARLSHDAQGHLVAVDAPGLNASWRWHNGHVVSHSSERDGIIRTTEIERDEQGRVAAQVVDGVRTRFSHDDAGQLIGSVCDDGVTRVWEWDAGGRLVSESVDGATTTYRYDAAGQLLGSTRPDGAELSFEYDAAGRRVRQRAGQVEQQFAWSPEGFLASITTASHGDGSHGDDAQGDGSGGDRGPRLSTRTLTRDGLGQLVGINDTAVVPDSAGDGSPVMVGLMALANFGAGVGAAASGQEPTWASTVRAQHDLDASDPWSTAGVDSGLPAGIQLDSDGSLSLDGFELTGARVYDPSTRGFLSVDPLPPLLATTWAANPYSWAGNDPLNLSDPRGLHPLTDAEMDKWRDQNGGLEGWWNDNWEYVVAGVVVAAGLVVMATGVGGPIGAGMISAALISGGTSIAEQKFENGEVQWGQVAVEAAVGAATSLVGGLASKGVSNAVKPLIDASGFNTFGKEVILGSFKGAASGSVTEPIERGADYLMSDAKNKGPMGFANEVADGFVDGLGEGFTHGAQKGAMKNLLGEWGYPQVSDGWIGSGGPCQGCRVLGFELDWGLVADR